MTSESDLSNQRDDKSGGSDHVPPHRGALVVGREHLPLAASCPFVDLVIGVVVTVDRELQHLVFMTRHGHLFRSAPTSRRRLRGAYRGPVTA